MAHRLASQYDAIDILCRTERQAVQFAKDYSLWLHSWRWVPTDQDGITIRLNV